MKILLLSFYFQPDLCAGSFRATALAQALKEVDPTINLEVITTLPNRYRSYSPDALEYENIDGVTVFRIKLPRHKSGLYDQSVAFLHFAWHTMKLSRGKKYDIVIATSSRLMTASLGAFIANRKATALYIDIRDIFTDTIRDTLPSLLALAIRPLFLAIEQYAVKKASHVNLVSRGFEDYYCSKFSSKKFSYFSNGIDHDFLSLNIIPINKLSTRELLTVVYAGNIGDGQGLHIILPKLAKKFEGRLVFKVIGDGGRKELLRQSLASAEVTNVILLDPIPRKLLVEDYISADVLFLHLNNYEAFRKVLPSKLFEYAAVGKPIWAGVSGYSAEFVRTEITNAAVFTPCDADAAMIAFDSLEIKNESRTNFIQKYSRENICRELAKDIIKCCKV
jgi:glycosyltransferase involved in cell wall biosynthesis